jgi:hypothetical protein
MMEALVADVHGLMMPPEATPVKRRANVSPKGSWLPVRSITRQ